MIRRQVAEVYAALAPGADIEFADLVKRVGPLDEEGLSDLIESDGRNRLGANRHISLDRYLQSIPALASRPVALDAAIEFTLRSMVYFDRLDGQSDDDATRTAVTTLVANYPHLAGPIRDSAALTEGLMATSQIAPGTEVPQPLRTVPSDIGPAIEDGRGRYELRELLGRGSHGVVYLAVDRKLRDRDKPAYVAVKIVRECTAPGARSIGSVEEAAKARRITHHNVVRVLDAWIDPVQCGDATHDSVIVCEYIDGGTLEAFVKGTEVRLPPRRAVELMVSVSRGVQAAHSAGLVHCDLKPSNVLMRSDGAPAVSDFGVACRVTPIVDDPKGVEEYADFREGRGNLAFSAPEQLAVADGWHNPPCDIFALGGLLLWLLTGELPRRLPEDAFEQLGRSHPATASVEDSLLRICERAMHPSVAGRYGSAEAFALDLERWLSHEPIAWTSPTMRTRARLWWKRSPGSMLGIIAAVLTFVIGSATIAGLIVRNSREAVAAEQAKVKAVQAELDRKTQALLGVATRFSQMWKSQDGTKMSTDWFAGLTVLETLMGPVVLGSTESPRGGVGGVQARNVWSDRIDTLERLLAAARASHQADSLEMLLWSDTLAFWHLRAGSFEQAAQELADSDPLWEAKSFKPDDPWLAFRQAMHAAAEVGTIAHDQNPSQSPDRIQLEKLESQLLTAADRLGLVLFPDNADDAALANTVQTISGGPVGVRTPDTQKAAAPVNPGRGPGIRLLVEQALRTLWQPSMLDKKADISSQNH